MFPLYTPTTVVPAGKEMRFFKSCLDFLKVFFSGQYSSLLKYLLLTTLKTVRKKKLSSTAKQRPRCVVLCKQRIVLLPSFETKRRKSRSETELCLRKRSVRLLLGILDDKQTKQEMSIQNKFSIWVNNIFRGESSNSSALWSLAFSIWRWMIFILAHSLWPMTSNLQDFLRFRSFLQRNSWQPLFIAR